MSRDVKHYMVDELEEWPFTEEFKRSNVPCVSISSYVLSPEEYMGFHISDLLESLVKESDGDLEKAENGAIVFGETEKTFIREDEYPIIGRPEDDEDEIRKRNIRMFKSSVHRIFGSIMQGTLVPIKYEGEDYLFDTSNLVIFDIST